MGLSAVYSKNSVKPACAITGTLFSILPLQLLHLCRHITLLLLSKVKMKNCNGTIIIVCMESCFFALGLAMLVAICLHYQAWNHYHKGMILVLTLHHSTKK